jgi:mono/diheme cytochrome c family protein
MAEVTGQPGGSREWTFRRRHVVAGLVVIVVLAAAFGVVSQQSTIGDLKSKNEALAASKTHAIQQRNVSQEALDSAQQELAGERVFEANCAVCHFREGGGGVGPQLFHGAVVQFVSEAQEVDKVSAGGPVMPAFGAILSSEEIRQVVAYTRAH